MVAALLLGLLLCGFALAVDFPKAAYGFQSDEASYYTLGHSLARDGDFAFDRGISRASTRSSRPARKASSSRRAGRAGSMAQRVPVDRARGRARHARRSPLLRQVLRVSAGRGAVRPGVRDQRLSRAARGAAVAEPARGLLVPARPQRADGGAGLRCGVLRRLGGARLLRLDHAGDLQPVAGRARPVLRPVQDGEPRGAARRRLVEPLPARRRRAVLGAAIIGVAAFSKPTNAALAVPIVAAALLRRDWRIGASAALAFVPRAAGCAASTSRPAARSTIRAVIAPPTTRPRDSHS